jgi:outer membrane protein TolC
MKGCRNPRKTIERACLLLCGAGFVWSGCSLPAQAQAVSFGSVSQKAIERSYDLALSNIDTALSKNKVREAKIPYYPTLASTFNTQYVYGFDSQNTPAGQQAVVIGNSMIPGANTRFQSAISLNANYTVADFGIRANQLKAARQHAASSQLQESIHARDLRLDVLDAYTQALLTYKQIRSKERQNKLQSQLYELNTRLWNAGKISRIELGEQAIVLKNTEDELHELRQTLGDNLNKLSSYTQEPYYVASVKMEDFDSEQDLPLQPFMPAATPDFKAYQLLIKEKISELRSIKAQRYPQLVAFSNFVLYGSDKGNWMTSLGGFRARAAYFGIGLQLPIFDAGKTKIAVDGKKLEIARLTAERDKRLWELRSDYQKSATAANLYRVELDTKAELVSNSKEQLGMVIRLTANQVAERSKALAEQIELAKHQLAEETTRTRSVAAAKRLRIYSEIASK